MADRVERLTNLLALLLETTEPLSLVAIAGSLGGQYPDGLNAMRGAFERDKAALREIGVPIEQSIVTGGAEAGQTRYWIDRDRYELRDLELDDDERRALQVAMAATRPGSLNAQEAAWKVGVGLLDEGVMVTAVVPDNPALPVLREAISARRSVRLRYRDVDRTIDPWGILLRSGFWYLIGLDHGHGERRTFRIDRIDGAVEPVDGSRFDRPVGFDPRSAFPDDPKLIGADPDVADGLVRISAVRAASVERDLGADQVVTRHPDGSIEVRVPRRNQDAFRSWVLGYLEHAEVLAPPDARADIVAWVTNLAGAPR